MRFTRSLGGALGLAALLAVSSVAPAAAIQYPKFSIAQKTGALGDVLTLNQLAACPAGSPAVLFFTFGLEEELMPVGPQPTSLGFPYSPSAPQRRSRPQCCPAGLLGAEYAVVQYECTGSEDPATAQMWFDIEGDQFARIPGNNMVEHHVWAVYADLFGREPDTGGFDGWTHLITSDTPRIAVADSIGSSREFRATLIDDAYGYWLGRDADAAGLHYWLDQMAAGLTIEALGARFVGSPEYYAQSGGTPEGWVDALYGDVVGRDADDAGREYWVDVLVAGTPRSAVANGFLMSYEYVSTQVNGYYQGLLGRDSDPAGRHYWTIAIAQQGRRDEQIIGGIGASDEYFSLVTTG